ncbi:3-hydroxyacid dehydrogenase [Corynebacterium phocae]|uniref:3-hydroxyacid dehydrogenase n=1 Tax=Corynebacterium phocae TaxID=161895 RepID=A0A1L7D152_9CORY|nr:NAD(P)-binding domain-containing protein [Corynebacterium phocae]APT91830.1 3-hydroxyacid dehydrogenase [Corynebacterium phocae]KAA8727948.1 NAD(P)-dependent oxidoreductase [Corynebacterium phocae]
MKIAFLGTGRMGTELARHLINDHEVTVWNRTRDRAQHVGAPVAAAAEEAVAGAELVVSSLFGPDTVREVITKPRLIPAGMTWVDTTTVSPEVAREFATAVEGYVHAPVIGSLSPARAGELGVYVGTPDAQRRDQVLELVRPWAHPDKLKGVESAAAAATGKLLANLALVVMAEGVLEALDLGKAEGFDAGEVLDMLDITGLKFMKDMKAPFILGQRDTAPGDFTVDALAKDARLMVATADKALPAVEAGIARLAREQSAGRGDTDFSSILVNRDGPAT